MIIRNAEIKDKDTVIDLVVVAIEDLSNILTGCEEDYLAKQKLKELYCCCKNRFSYEYCLVAEINGQVAGSIITYPGADINKLNILLIEKLKEKFIDNEKMFLKYSKDILNSKEAFDDEYYIDNLAVLKSFRGKGIGKKLIAEVEKDAYCKGYNKISILADVNNNKAFNIYQKLGYINDCELDVLGHIYYHLVKKNIEFININTVNNYFY